ncbi:MAG: tRNA (5-methylaminomethyl-2-thiouridine)(34)-methyltransferase MnmD [Pseudomonadota bacterium]
MQGQQADVTWKDGVPVSTAFDDPYYSLQNGLAETEHVFLAGNDLPARFCDGFHIAELGFGTGLNLLATLQAWRTADVTGFLHYTSFERFPMAPEDVAAALARFETLQTDADALCAALAAGTASFTLCDQVLVSLQIGDARKILPNWSGQADAWFLDGFSPAKNPELWEADLLKAVHDHTAPGGTAATYSAAGAVKSGLRNAGFEVTRAPGFGRKRHMTRARKV